MRLLMITALAGLVALPAAAQQPPIGNPGGAAPASPTVNGAPSPRQPNDTDRLFATLVGAGGLAEVAAARLAVERAQADAVRTFAQRMAEDHGKANDRLAAVAKTAGLTLPKDLDPDHKVMAAELKAERGGEFDLVYMRGQLQDHQATALLLQWEIGAGQHAALQQFAMQTLPVVLQHLEMAQAVLSDLAGQGPQAAAEDVTGSIDGQRPAPR